MKVAIVGSEGFVGGAMMSGFEDFFEDRDDLELMGIDIKKPETLVNYGKLAKDDIVFICVPTLYDPVIDGYNYEIVHEVIRKLAGLYYLPQRPAICLRSTVTPDFFDDPISKNVDVYHPEFLCARTACADFRHPDIHIIGGNADICGKINKLYDWVGIQPKKMLYTSLLEAVYLKVVHNVYRALRISFLNELYVTMGGGDTWAAFQPLLSETFAARDFGGTYLSVPGPDGKFGFGGACFPKDVAAFLGWLRKSGHPNEIVSAVRAVNARMRIPT